ncbi:hypothetical protein SAMN04488134_111110 [Amphibacillus marinus]|uniref:DUF378 domain-containing protein n=1 Tax=Amphibacillus marinus TaxID=872970 RepID=A0A1H8S0N9_9BACI|nr:DUF378 domain-containing protein [Amphibacillus marinus]SEO72162.1 hypothetical protein SAMN04488134_111110 [Amphibacillus marinus]
MNALERIALVLVIIGAINWGLIGLLEFDLVATIFGGGSQAGVFARIIYALVGISGLVSLSILFKPNHEVEENHHYQPQS